MREIKDSLRGGAIPCMAKFVSEKLANITGDPFIYKVDENSLILCLLGDKGKVDSGEKFVTIVKGSRRDGGMCSIACEVDYAFIVDENTYYVCRITALSEGARKYYKGLPVNIPAALRGGSKKKRRKTSVEK